MSTHRDYRVGNGFDVHRLVEGRPCVLGGITLPHATGPLGHSDGDAVLHAITDAILGAAGCGDIGGLFPDSEPAWKDADSRVLLRRAVETVRATGWVVGNVDATVIAQAPRIAPHAAAMRRRIAEDLGIPVDRVNVKGKTTERLGFVGRREGIAAQAVALLVPAG